jgi:tripartite-type tricarboxylate transporter receptor subunit TctC
MNVGHARFSFLSRIRLKTGRAVVAAAVVSLLVPSAARAAWPDHPVTIIVPYAAGGNTDIMARLASDELQKKFGQPFLVENRPGAGGALGAQYVARAAPDGYTLLFGTTAQMSILPFIQQINYKPLTDFAPVAVFGQSFSILGIHRSVPATDLKGFIAYAKGNPGKINYASGGVGTVGHLVTALFAARAGLTMTHVPYKGGSQSMTDLLGGQVQIYFGNSSELLPYKDSETIRLIGVGTPARVEELPDVPAVAELYPGFSLPAWNGFLAPAGTPRSIIDQVAKVAIEGAQSPGVGKKLHDLGIQPGAAGPDQLGEIIRGEQALYKDAVKAAGIEP